MDAHNFLLHIASVSTQVQTHAQIYIHAQIPAYPQLPTLFQPHALSQPSAHLHHNQVTRSQPSKVKSPSSVSICFLPLPITHPCLNIPDPCHPRLSDPRSCDFLVQIIIHPWSL